MLLRTYRFGQPLINRGLSEHSRFLEQPTISLAFSAHSGSSGSALNSLAKVGLCSLNLLSGVGNGLRNTLQPPHISEKFSKHERKNATVPSLLMFPSSSNASFAF